MPVQPSLSSRSSKSQRMLLSTGRSMCSRYRSTWPRSARLWLVSSTTSTSQPSGSSRSRNRFEQLLAARPAAISTGTLVLRFFVAVDVVADSPARARPAGRTTGARRRSARSRRTARRPGGLPAPLRVSRSKLLLAVEGALSRKTLRKNFFKKPIGDLNLGSDTNSACALAAASGRRRVSKRRSCCVASVAAVGGGGGSPFGGGAAETKYPLTRFQPNRLRLALPRRCRKPRPRRDLKSSLASPRRHARRAGRPEWNSVPSAETCAACGSWRAEPWRARGVSPLFLFIAARDSSR